MVGLSIFTPVELVPLPLENVPRWGCYGLVFPACRLLQVCWSRAPVLANRAVARVGTTAGCTLFLVPPDGGPNPGQAVGGHRSAFNVTLCPSRGVAYLLGLISPRSSTSRCAALCSLGPATTSDAAGFLADGRRDARRARRTMGGPVTGPGVAGCHVARSAPSSSTTAPDALREVSLIPHATGTVEMEWRLCFAATALGTINSLGGSVVARA